MRHVLHQALALVVCVLMPLACSANLDQSAVKDLSALVAALSPECQQEVLAGQVAKNGRPNMPAECRQQLFKAAAALSRASGVEPTEFLAALAGKVQKKAGATQQSVEEAEPASSTPQAAQGSYTGLWVALACALGMLGWSAYIMWPGKKQRRPYKRS